MYKVTLDIASPAVTHTTPKSASMPKQPSMSLNTAPFSIFSSPSAYQYVGRNLLTVFTSSPNTSSGTNIPPRNENQRLMILMIISFDFRILVAEKDEIKTTIPTVTNVKIRRFIMLRSHFIEKIFPLRKMLTNTDIPT